MTQLSDVLLSLNATDRYKGQKSLKFIDFLSSQGHVTRVDGTRHSTIAHTPAVSHKTA